MKYPNPVPLFADLLAEMRKHPQYISGDDDLTTAGGVLTTAILFIGRMADDLRAVQAQLDEVIRSENIP